MKVADAGRVVMAGFDGAWIDEHVREALKLGVAGFILFRRNIESPAQTRELIAEIRALAGDRRLLFAVDQEGGRVARLPEPATQWPPMRVLGRIAEEDLARRFGAAVGAELRAIGFDIDFAPVVDVDTNPANPVIGDRSFGRDPDLVGRLGAAVVAGLQDAGVWAGAKHFPGHGDTELDSHLELPFVPHDRRRLDSVELPPFAAAVRAGVAALMTAHVVVEVLDPERPATMSPPILRILREELDFSGVIVSDDLEMKAITDHFGVGEAAVAAAKAGADLMLVCHSLERQEEAVRALYDAHLAGALPPLRLDEMQRRLHDTMTRFPKPESGDLMVVGCEEHQALRERILQCGA
ncbi:MAG: beta-N-acetylhexosaminidase [Alphaproteobacteria bacterium]